MNLHFTHLTHSHKIDRLVSGYRELDGEGGQTGALSDKLLGK